MRSVTATQVMQPKMRCTEDQRRTPQRDTELHSTGNQVGTPHGDNGPKRPELPVVLPDNGPKNNLFVDSSSVGVTTTAGLAIVVFVATAAALLEKQRCDTWAAVLRAWWVDPAVATLSFSFAVDVYDRRERQTGLEPRDGTTLSSALLLYWIGVGLWCHVVDPPAGIQQDGIPHSLADLAYLLLEVVSGVILYDFIFFLIHWALHSTSSKAHKRHHSTGHDLRARDVLEHSPLDGTLQVLVNIMVQRSTWWDVGPKSRLARALHNIAVTWMLTESHSSAPTPYVARRWFVGVRRHRAHHLHGAPIYQQFFGYLDDLRSAWCSER